MPSVSSPRYVVLTAPVIAISVITVLTKVVGFAEKQLLAYFFGTGDIVDAYLVATGLAMTLFVFAREVVEPSFLPLFVSLRSRGDLERSQGVVQLTLVLVLVLWLPASLGALAAPERVASALAPGLDARAHDVAATLIRWVTPASGLLMLSSITYLVLNSHDRFGLPAAGDLTFKAAVVAGVAVAGLSGTPITGLALGFAVGASARLATHLTGLRGWPWGRTTQSWLCTRIDAKALLALMLPVLLGSAFAQLSELADNWFASTVAPGVIAARSYAKKVVDLPVLLLPYALSIVLFPKLAQLHARRNDQQFHETLSGCMWAMTYLFVPLAICSAMLAEPVVRLLFERGKFDVSSRHLTASALRMYSLGLPIFALEALVVPAFFARQRPALPVLLGMLGVLINVLSMALLVPDYGIRAVAGALVVSKLVKLTLLLGALVAAARRPVLQPPGRLIMLVVATGAAVLASRGAAEVLSLPPGGFVSLSTYCAEVALVTLAAFFGTCAALSRGVRHLIGAVIRNPFGWLKGALRTDRSA